MHLMLKDKPVLMFLRTSSEIRIHEILEPELLPLAIRENCNANKLSKWLEKRCISSNREGIDEVVNKYGKSVLTCKNYASLSDQYWIQTRDEKWKRINFFQKKYQNDLGRAFFTPWEIDRISTQDSPEHTTTGVVRKMWVQNESTLKSRLIKAGSKAAKQSPLYEVLVAVLCEQLDIPVANYSLCSAGHMICSSCDNFIDENTDLVTAAEIYNTEKRPDDVDINTHLLRMCDKFEIPGVKELIDNITLIDTLTGNTDRNLSNIGFIRDINTMKFIGPAPIFDSGNAYWDIGNMKRHNNGELFDNLETKVFKESCKKYDLEQIFSDSSFEAMIENYPGFSNEKKVNLIKVIKKRNSELKKILI